MARQRKKKGRPVSGWVILDKPHSMGSTEAVAKIKWLFHAQKAGHAGTLDPLASGMLPIALGETTKTVPYVMNGSKVYQFTVAWGEERTTDDLEGETTKTSNTRPDQAAIQALLPKYTGIISQVPPQFSAIKLQGQRAYDLARDGETVEIPSREVEIYSLTLIDATDNNRAIFEVECGKGTYVRALARDMGRDLACYGHIADLRRIEVFPFDENDFVTLEALEQAAPQRGEPDKDGVMPPRDFAALDRLLLETAIALEDLTHYPLSSEQACRIRQGNTVLLRGSDVPLDEDEVYVTQHNKLLAIGAIDKGHFKPKRVFTC